MKPKKTKIDQKRLNEAFYFALYKPKNRYLALDFYSVLEYNAYSEMK